jgi:hypothetical protein
MLPANEANRVARLAPAEPEAFDGLQIDPAAINSEAFVEDTIFRDNRVSEMRRPPPADRPA